MTVQKILFTVSEAAQLGRTGRSTIYAAIAAGELPSFKRGRTRLIRRECLAWWLGVPERDLIELPTSEVGR